MRAHRPTAVPRRAGAAARRTLAAACGAALLAASATPAHAQFGKLLKRAASAATEAATGSAADRATGAVAERAGVAAPDRGAANLLEITPARLDAFVAAMRPLADAERRAARDRAAADAAADSRREAARRYEARRQAYNSCHDAATEGTPSVSPAQAPRLEPLVRRFTDLNGRQHRAAAAGDARRAAALADSVAATQAAMDEVMFPGLAKRCGPPPRPSEAPDAAPAARDDVAPAARPAVPAGMTPAQFGLLRERVAAWALGAGRRYTFGAGETAALEGRRAALADLVPYFKADYRRWANPTAGLDGEA